MNNLGSLPRASQGRKTRVAHTSCRTLAGCMRLLDSGADMPNYGTSAPPVTVFHGVSRAEGPWGQTSRNGCLRLPARPRNVTTRSSEKWRVASAECLVAAVMPEILSTVILSPFGSLRADCAKDHCGWFCFRQLR